MKPKLDDFRVDHDDLGLTITFTPTGQSFRFEVQQGRDATGPGHRSQPAVQGDYDEQAVCDMAAELARGFFSEQSRLPG
jgi:hypothetical protein